MEAPAKTICLCMIVRNEAHIIRRALESARPHIAHWVICDTGSTDDTPGVIVETMLGIPGELHRVPWVNFGHNREEVLRLARGKADYFLILDADMVVHAPEPFRHLLHADAYEIAYTGDLDYTQRMLVSSQLDWRYIGVTHEYIHAEGIRTVSRLRELSLVHFGDGGMRADKFERDARLLTEALAADPDNPRNLFYLAQSHRDLGRHHEALISYEKRAAMEGTWEEERWYAQFQAARMKLLCGFPWDECLAALLAAYHRRPARLEPLHELVRHLREQQAFPLAYALGALAGHGYAYPVDDMLFIEKPVYEYLLPLEYAVCAYGVGRVSEAIAAFNTVLRQERLPQWVQESAERGRAMALADLYPAAKESPARRNPILVIAAFHNAGAFLEKNVRSLLAQDYENFEVVFINDASTDGCEQCIPFDDPRVRVIHSGQRLGLLGHLHSVLTAHRDPDTIIALVDGDDWLTEDGALTALNDFYNLHDCWVAYGQFRYASDGTRGFCEPFAAPRDIAVQRSHWRVSHLKSFRAGLFHRIADQDPEYLCLKDEHERWLTSAADAAVMYPLVEMAGFDRVRYNDRCLYVYNDQNPRSHHAMDREAQWANLLRVAAKRPFAPVPDFAPASAEAPLAEILAST